VAAVASSTGATHRRLNNHPSPPSKQVYLCSRKEDEVAAAVEELRAAGFSAQGSAADVSQRGECEELVRCVAAAFGSKLDVLSECGLRVGVWRSQPFADDLLC
jgi:NAD(P)-dependent dehydrogenase (short-subunit alcohol dehydrogenase family)